MANSLNTFSGLVLDSKGVELGQNMFQSFLLAGERYLQANMQRPNTDEARFRDFYTALPTTAKEPIASYFKRQAGLGSTQRAQLLGSLTNLHIETPLTIYTTAPVLTAAPAFKALSDQILNNRLKFASLTAQPKEPLAPPASAPTPPPPAPPAPAPAPAFDLLRLYVNKLTVEKSQDAVWTPFGYVNTTDEVTLGYVAIDENGDVSKGNMTVGDIEQGHTKNYPGDGAKLVGFNLHEGTTFPKFYSVSVYAIERDSGGYNDMLQKAADYAKDKVTKEMLARGITEVGGYFGITIPPSVANFIANVVKSFFDKLVNWLANLLSNADDVLGIDTVTATIYNLNSMWNSSGTLSAPPFDWVADGQGGRWRTTMHWQFAKK